MEDVLKSGYYNSTLGYDNVDLFNEVKKLENKMAVCFKNTSKDINMTQEGKEVYRKNIICRFCEKNSIL